MRSLDVAGEGSPGEVPSAVRAEPGAWPAKLAAEPASGVPDPAAGGRALRDASPAGGAAATELLPGGWTGTLPGPDCGECGRPMVRCQERKARPFLTRLGRVEAERRCFRRRRCGRGRLPLDRAPGLEGRALTPGMADVMARTAPPMGFGAAAARIADLAGVKASPGSPRRRALALGREAMESGRGEVIGDSPLESRMYLTVDGTGIPMRREGTEGVRGRQGDGSAGTRGGRLAVVYTAEGRDREAGAATEDRGSEPVGCLAGCAAAPSGGREPSASAARPARGARRRGPGRAGEPGAVSDGAEWTPGTCGELFGGRRVTYALDFLHAPGHPSDAGRAIHPEGPERDRRFAEVRADTGAGRAGRVVRGLEPHRDRTGEVEACCRHFRNSIGRMRYDSCRERGIQTGSGVVEAGCRQSGLRLKRSGTRRSKKGANAMPSLKSCVMSHRLADFLDWRANQPAAVWSTFWATPKPNGALSFLQFPVLLSRDHG